MTSPLIPAVPTDFGGYNDDGPGPWGRWGNGGGMGGPGGPGGPGNMRGGGMNMSGGGMSMNMGMGMKSNYGGPGGPGGPGMGRNGGWNSGGGGGGGGDVGGYNVHMRGLPFRATQSDIAEVRVIQSLKCSCERFPIVFGV